MKYQSRDMLLVVSAEFLHLTRYFVTINYIDQGYICMFESENSKRAKPVDATHSAATNRGKFQGFLSIQNA